LTDLIILIVDQQHEQSFSDIHCFFDSKSSFDPFSVSKNINGHIMSASTRHTIAAIRNSDYFNLVIEILGA
jgi:hypothetical protein